MRFSIDVIMKLTDKQKEEILAAIYAELDSEQLDLAVKISERVIAIVEEAPIQD
jgi:hypothetical protein